MKDKSLQTSKLSKIVAVWLFILYGSSALAFGEAFMVSDAPDVTQSSPDVAFDDSGNIHYVWTDMQDDDGDYPPYIYHCMQDRLTGNRTVQNLPIPSACFSETCGLGNPRIVFGLNDPNDGYAMSSWYSSTEFQNVRLDVGANTWAFDSQVTPGTTLLPHFSIASTAAISGDFLFVAYSDFDAGSTGIEFKAYDGSNWDATATVISPTPPNSYNSVEIASDSDGYIYAVFEERDFRGDLIDLWTVRSSNPNDITAFGPLRRVTASPGTDPVITVRPDDSSPTVCIAWVLGNSVRTHIESGGDWTMVNDFSGNETNVSSTSVAPVDPDCVFGYYNMVHVVWSDQRSGDYKVYYTESYDLGLNYLSGSGISIKNAGISAVEPRIAFNSDPFDIAIVYRVFDGPGGTSNIYSRVKTGLTSIEVNENSGDDYDEFSIHTCDSTFTGISHDADNECHAFISESCIIGNVFADKFLGQISYWFYDDYSNAPSPTPNPTPDPSPTPVSNHGITGDYYFKIWGDNGSKAGVMRGLGIVNEVSEDEYAFGNTEDISLWSPTGIFRTQGWHHVVVEIDLEGIRMWLDPEVLPDPISDLQTSEFLLFDRYELRTETLTGIEPVFYYYMDEWFEIRYKLPELPAFSWLGMLILAAGFSALIISRKT